MNPLSPLQALTRMFTVMAFVGACMLLTGVGLAIWLRGPGMPIVVTVLIGMGGVMVGLGLRARRRGQRMSARVTEERGTSLSTTSLSPSARRQWAATGARRAVAIGNTLAGLLVSLIAIVVLAPPWALFVVTLMAVGVAETWHLVRRLG